MSDSKFKIKFEKRKIPTTIRLLRGEEIEKMLLEDLQELDEISEILRFSEEIAEPDYTYFTIRS